MFEGSTVEGAATRIASACDRRSLIGTALGLSVLLFSPSTAATQEPVRFTTSDGGEIHALLWKGGDEAVVLAHGRVFDAESWRSQSEVLHDLGLTVLSIDFRGYGDSTAGSEGRNGLPNDVIGAVGFLEGEGARTVSVVGGSMGGWASGMAAARLGRGRLKTLILLAPPPIPEAARMQAETIVLVVAEGDPLADGVREMAGTVGAELIVLPGSDHAQHIFRGEQGPELLQILVSRLSR